MRPNLKFKNTFFLQNVFHYNSKVEFFNFLEFIFASRVVQSGKWQRLHFSDSDAESETKIASRRVVSLHRRQD